MMSKLPYTKVLDVRLATYADSGRLASDFRSSENRLRTKSERVAKNKRPKRVSGSLLFALFAELWSQDGEGQGDDDWANRIHHHSGRRPHRIQGEQRAEGIT